MVGDAEDNDVLEHPEAWELWKKKIPITFLESTLPPVANNKFRLIYVIKFFIKFDLKHKKITNVTKASRSVIFH